MGSLSVETSQLPAAAVRIADAGRELAAVQGAMGRVSAAAYAADAPGVTQALSALSQALAMEAGSVGVSTEALAATTSRAGEVYEQVDRNAFGSSGAGSGSGGGGW